MVPLFGLLDCLLAPPNFRLVLAYHPSWTCLSPLLDMPKTGVIRPNLRWYCPNEINPCYQVKIGYC